MPATTANPTDVLSAFAWVPHPEAQIAVEGILNRFFARNPAAAALAERMKNETGTRFFDWVDHIVLLPDENRVSDLLRVGYEIRRIDGITHLHHPGGIFPPIVVDGAEFSVAIKVESLADFAAAANGLSLHSSESFAPYSEMIVAEPTKGIPLRAVERHGYRGFKPPTSIKGRGAKPDAYSAALSHLEQFRARQRNFDDDSAGFTRLNKLIDSSIRDLGVDLTCDLFFRAEREFWQSRNHAAQVQKARQDKLGLGWANHDHHTYRSSRKYFVDLIALCEKLGFACRERFYAGAQAGWGAQVLEQTTAGIVVFADVDLSPDELVADFSHEPLPVREALGTVGLWCALHGEALLQAGMHHLECQFDFDSLQAQLEREDGIRTMKPFTDLPYLKQAFTEGERWAVDPKRIDALLKSGRITQPQADQFRAQGAIGSHLENLERNAGFKGFNQKGVSEIIASTDPRRHLAH
jgi:hypothetical protein